VYLNDKLPSGVTLIPPPPSAATSIPAVPIDTAPVVTTSPEDRHS
jgi:hypothetical protein